MPKKLQDMTLEELWELFPIVLEPHNPDWLQWAVEEIDLLKALLGKDVVITHIGSTAIPGIQAKPIVDILVEIPDKVELSAISEALTGSGYLCMNQSPARMSFNKGYTPLGYAERVFHIHLRRSGDNAEISFRDYLRTHPDVAKDYEALKIALATRYKHNRDAYTSAKTEFVMRFTDKS